MLKASGCGAAGHRAATAGDQGWQQRLLQQWLRVNRFVFRGLARPQYLSTHFTPLAQRAAYKPVVTVTPVTPHRQCGMPMIS